MKIVGWSDKNINPFYFLFWIILIIGKGLNLDGESIQMQTLTFIGLMIGFIGIIRTKYTKEEIINVLFLLGLGFMKLFLEEK